MSFNMRYEGTDKLEVFLGNLEIDCRKAGEAYQKEAAKIIKARVVGQLSKLRTTTNNSNYKHMADDVQIRTVKSDFGDSVTRIQGGKKTGTKWHLVNDGTYRTHATHFMDNALKESDSELRSIIDKELSKIGD